MKKITMGVALFGAFAAAQVVALVDLSGSMCGMRHETASSLKKLHRQVKGVRAIGFNDGVIGIDLDRLTTLPCGGNTNLTAALHESRSEGAKTIFILTDGAPQDPLGAAIAAKELRSSGVKICSVLIGGNDGTKSYLESISDKVYRYGSGNGEIFRECLGYAKSRWNIQVVKEDENVTLDSMESEKLTIPHEEGGEELESM